MVYPSFDLAGQWALVTGATRGIGQHAALTLAHAGANVVCSGRDQAALDETLIGLSASGRQAVGIVAELSDADQVRRLGEQAVKASGGISILVNNAGLSHVEPSVSATVEHWDETLDVNLRAPFLLSQTVVDGMIKLGGGSIINVASAAAHNGLREHAAYCASKGGLILLTQTLALEWADYNIRVNAVSPTVILTPMGERVWGDPAKRDPMLAKIPLGRFGYPVDVSGAILYLASSASNMVTGTTLVVDGGYGAQ
ncbi:MAG: SDR family oxidoreductase [Armatimonadetes bacterium]|nr:SDR family oxidoreductase [Armatimonadota bacterium]